MTHEWKPGDVAMVGGVPAMRFAYNTLTCSHAFDGDHWHRSDGYWISDESVQGDRARPLVVIDPEDAEAVGRLVKIIEAEAGGPEALEGLPVINMTRVLREFAQPTPPKPDEPQGLGAVVEDDHGVKWVRAGCSYTDPNWRVAGGDAWVRFDAIRAVEVLSEGVIA